MSRSGCSGNPDKCACVFPFCPQIIWSIRPRSDSHYNYRFPIYRLGLNIRNDLRHTGIRYGIRNTIHHSKKLVFIYSDNFSRLIIYTKNQLAALRIGKCNNRLCIFFRIFWNRYLKFYIFRLSMDNFFNRHVTDLPLMINSQSFVRKYIR